MGWKILEWLTVQALKRQNIKALILFLFSLAAIRWISVRITYEGTTKNGTECSLENHQIHCTHSVLYLQFLFQMVEQQCNSINMLQSKSTSDWWNLPSRFKTMVGTLPQFASAGKLVHNFELQPESMFLSNRKFCF